MVCSYNYLGFLYSYLKDLHFYKKNNLDGQLGGQLGGQKTLKFNLERQLNNTKNIL